MTSHVPDHCPYCGKELEWRHVEGRERLFCDSCDRIVYRNPKPTASVAVVRDSSVLLVKRRVEPDRGEWGLPAGYIEIGETPSEAASRELAEETGLTVNPENLRLLDTVSSEPFTGKHVISIGHVVPVTAVSGNLDPGKETALARFWNPNELAAATGESLREHDRDRVRTAIESLGRSPSEPDDVHGEEQNGE
jgi:8-oxo-dGTP diphosphatase